MEKKNFFQDETFSQVKNCKVSTVFNKNLT